METEIISSDHSFMRKIYRRIFLAAGLFIFMIIPNLTYANGYAVQLVQDNRKSEVYNCNIEVPICDVHFTILEAGKAPLSGKLELIFGKSKVLVSVRNENHEPLYFDNSDPVLSLALKKEPTVYTLKIFKLVAVVPDVTSAALYLSPEFLSVFHLKFTSLP